MHELSPVYAKVNVNGLCFVKICINYVYHGWHKQIAEVQLLLARWVVPHRGSPESPISYRIESKSENKTDPSKNYYVNNLQFIAVFLIDALFSYRFQNLRSIRRWFLLACTLAS